MAAVAPSDTTLLRSSTRAATFDIHIVLALATPTTPASSTVLIITKTSRTSAGVIGICSRTSGDTSVYRKGGADESSVPTTWSLTSCNPILPLT